MFLYIKIIRFLRSSNVIFLLFFLVARKVDYLFPIQSQTFDTIYDGHDIIVKSRTGTGKTLAFALPVVEKLHQNCSKQFGRSPICLGMAPTRELAKQVTEDFLSLSTSLKILSVFGGTPYSTQGE